MSAEVSTYTLSDISISSLIQRCAYTAAPAAAEQSDAVVDELAADEADHEDREPAEEARREPVRQLALADEARHGREVEDVDGRVARRSG